MKPLLIYLFFLTVVNPGIISAQRSDKVAIRGTVFDSDKEPIPGAIIMINGKRTKTVTNLNGSYKIWVLPSDTLIGVFTFGNGLYEDNINGRNRIDFNFETALRDNDLRNSGISVQSATDVAAGDEAVNTGYGHLKKKNLTTDITFIDGTNKKYASYNSVYDMIMREVSGVRISGDRIIIQESSNMGGSVPALLIVDGTFAVTLRDISPSMVKSISVLKGTAAAIYGSRGYGGAVIVETKSYDE